MKIAGYQYIICNIRWKKYVLLSFKQRHTCTLDFHAISIASFPVNFYLHRDFVVPFKFKNAPRCNNNGNFRPLILVKYKQGNYSTAYMNGFMFTITFKLINHRVKNVFIRNIHLKLYDYLSRCLLYKLYI